jgi:hypothetical protein
MHDRRPRDDLPFKRKPEQPAQRPQITINGTYAHASSLSTSGEAGNNLWVDLGDLCICKLSESQQTCNSSCIEPEAALFDMQSRVVEKPSCEIAQNGSFGRRRFGPRVERVNLTQADRPAVLVLDLVSFSGDRRPR